MCLQRTEYWWFAFVSEITHAKNPIAHTHTQTCGLWRQKLLWDFNQDCVSFGQNPNWIYTFVTVQCPTNNSLHPQLAWCVFTSCLSDVTVGMVGCFPTYFCQHTCINASPCTQHNISSIHHPYTRYFFVSCLLDVIFGMVGCFPTVLVLMLPPVQSMRHAWEREPLLLEPPPICVYLTSIWCHIGHGWVFSNPLDLSPIYHTHTMQTRPKNARIYNQKQLQCEVHPSLSLVSASDQIERGEGRPSVWGAQGPRCDGGPGTSSPPPICVYCILPKWPLETQVQVWHEVLGHPAHFPYVYTAYCPCGLWRPSVGGWGGVGWGGPSSKCHMRSWGKIFVWTTEWPPCRNY